MKNVIVASTNPVKINAVKLGFAAMFPHEQWTVEGRSIASGVADQPMTDEETLRGAGNRASGAQQSDPDADYWVGIEGGCQESENDIEVFAWIVVFSKEGMLGRGRTGTFFLPQAIKELVRSGMELSDADSVVFGRENAKHKNGTVGILTDDCIDRTSYYEHAMILALIPFKNIVHYSL